ncbi:hypothetical protein WICPIJ_008963 [Wickerhamomyces pijperi]|uniref:Uncharacterized protein n=1 Tax=Wickerhamomyces pijperi TaxID=599730 RepID=A0A9P8TGI7_WICPI|nr:hypothetical protein WICPIJ_008963 [Wickerhamomyces pijperi]
MIFWKILSILAMFSSNFSDFSFMIMNSLLCKFGDLKALMNTSVMIPPSEVRLDPDPKPWSSDLILRLTL